MEELHCVLPWPFVFHALGFSVSVFGKVVTEM